MRARSFWSAAISCTREEPAKAEPGRPHRAFDRSVPVSRRSCKPHTGSIVLVLSWTLILLSGIAVSVGKCGVARWREEVILADGSASRVMRSVVLGPVSEITRREARKLLNAHLNPVNQGQYRPEGTMLYSRFIEECFIPGVLPTLKYATQEIYSLLLRTHLIPRFGGHRLCDISRVEIQQYLLEKLKQGYAWETTNHLRHLLSKVLGTAVNWEYIPNNPVRGVKMPERTLKRPHRFLTAEEVQRLVAASSEPL